MPVRPSLVCSYLYNGQSSYSNSLGPFCYAYDQLEVRQPGLVCRGTGWRLANGAATDGRMAFAVVKPMESLKRCYCDSVLRNTRMHNVINSNLRHY